MSENCLFCRIIKRDIPGNIIDENEMVLAFRDINPQADTHVLIIPKIHIESTRKLEKDNIHYLSEMATMANQISESEGIANEGFRWVINTGNDGGQTVDHLHLHVLGGRQMNWPPG